MINGYGSPGALRLEARRAIEARLAVLLGPPKGPSPGAEFEAEVHEIVAVAWAELAGKLLEEALGTESRLSVIAQRIRAAFSGATAAAAAVAICSSPQQEAWIAQRVEGLTAAGRLLTDAQYIDLSAGRRLRAGDRARYVGLTRIEPMGARAHGQIGTITSAVKSADGVLKVVFQPDINPAAREAALADDLDVTIVQLVVSDALHAGYFDLERIVA